MAKTIKLNNVRIKEILLSKVGDQHNISVLYGILQDTGEEFQEKRDSIEDLTTGQKNKLEAIFTLLKSKLKAKEGLE